MAYRIGGCSLATKHGSSRSVESALLTNRTALQTSDELEALRWLSSRGSLGASMRNVPSGEATYISELAPQDSGLRAMGRALVSFGGMLNSSAAVDETFTVEHKRRVSEMQMNAFTLAVVDTAAERRF